MTNFNTSKNTFISSLQLLKTSFHGYTIGGIPKGTKQSKQQKKSTISQLTNAIEDIDTNDFGIRVVIIKTTE
jgi:hypothetical protein